MASILGVSPWKALLRIYRALLQIHRAFLRIHQKMNASCYKTQIVSWMILMIYVLYQFLWQDAFIFWYGRERALWIHKWALWIHKISPMLSTIHTLLFVGRCVWWINGWFMSYMNVSCEEMSHVSDEWGMSHMNESCHIWMSHVPWRRTQIIERGLSAC